MWDVVDIFATPATLLIVIFRGQHIGEKLVRRSMTTAKKLRFRILQFNAVVKSNHVALNPLSKISLPPNLEQFQQDFSIKKHPDITFMVT